MKYRYSLLKEAALVLEGGKESNRLKTPFFCVLVSASLVALETNTLTGIKESTSQPLLSVYTMQIIVTGHGK